jgi:CheY-like chemotaxis protein
MLNILIIENDKALQKLYRILFKMLGHYIIDVAYNGIEGIKLFRKHKELIDVIILDNSMPYMKGIDFINYLKDETNNIIIIFITGDKNIKKDLSNLEIDYFLPKPFEMKKIITIFENIEKEINNNSNGIEQLN